MVENDDVGTPSGMVDNDDWSPGSSGMEIVKRRRLQEGFESRQDMNLRNKLVAIIHKLPLPHHKVAKSIHPHGAIVSIIITVIC